MCTLSRVVGPAYPLSEWPYWAAVWIPGVTSSTDVVLIKEVPLDADPARTVKVGWSLDPK